MIDHTRCLQSPPASGARRQIIFVATCEVSAPAPLMETLFLTESNEPIHTSKNRQALDRAKLIKFHF